jgi:energy-coupling factor transporter ATP-binding protein EcfA2
MARLDQTVIAADPLTAVNASQKAGVYIVIDEPQFGFDNASIENLVEAVKTWLTSANINAMLASRH